MADFTDFYNAQAGVAPSRSTQAPQGSSPSVTGNFGVSAGLGAAGVDLWGALVLLGLALFILHLE